MSPSPSYEAPIVVHSKAGHFITSKLQLDVATLVARLQQLRDEHGEDMRDFLVHRLTTCDLPRLRGYLQPEFIAMLDDLFPEPSDAS
jgi:hypothetical protein